MSRSGISSPDELLLFYVVDFGAELAFKNIKAFNDEFMSVSERISRASFILVLAVQCLVFVVGVFIVGASVSRYAFFVLVGADASRRVADEFIVSDDARTHLVHTVTLQCLDGLTEERHQVALSTGDIPSSVTTTRLYSETKV